MNNLIYADVFFFVTTVAVVVFLAVGLVVAVYLVFILRDLRRLVRRGRAEGEELLNSLAAWREWGQRWLRPRGPKKRRQSND
jgi:hypothetical protein